MLLDSTNGVETKTIIPQLLEEEEEPEVEFDDDFFQICRPDGLVIILRLRRRKELTAQNPKRFKLEAVVVHWGNHFNVTLREQDAPQFTFNFTKYNENSTGQSAFLWASLDDGQINECHTSLTYRIPKNQTTSFISRPWAQVWMLGNKLDVPPISPWYINEKNTFFLYANNAVESYATNSPGFSTNASDSYCIDKTRGTVLELTYIRNAVSPGNELNKFVSNLSKTVIKSKQEEPVSGKLSLSNYSLQTIPGAITYPSLDFPSPPPLACSGRAELARINIILDQDLVESRDAPTPSGSLSLETYAGHELNLFNPYGNASAYCKLQHENLFNVLQVPSATRICQAEIAGYTGRTIVEQPSANKIECKNETDFAQAERSAVTVVGVDTIQEPTLLTRVFRDNGQVATNILKAPKLGNSKVYMQPGAAYEIYGRQLYLNTDYVAVKLGGYRERNASLSDTPEFFTLPSMWENWSNPKPISFTRSAGGLKAEFSSGPPIANYVRYPATQSFEVKRILHVQETDKYFDPDSSENVGEEYVEWVTYEATPNAPGGYVYYKYGTYTQFLSNPFRQGAVRSRQEYLDGTVARSDFSVLAIANSYQNVPSNTSWNNSEYMPRSATQGLISNRFGTFGIASPKGMQYLNTIGITTNIDNVAKSRRKLQRDEVVLHCSSRGVISLLSPAPDVNRPSVSGGATVLSPDDSQVNDLVKFDSFLNGKGLFDILNIPDAYRAFYKGAGKVVLQTEIMKPSIRPIPTYHSHVVAQYFFEDNIPKTAGQVRYNLGNL